MSDAKSKIEAEMERDLQNAINMGRAWDQIFSTLFDPPKANAPYPWCLHPEICVGKGYCPRDPNCGE